MTAKMQEEISVAPDHESNKKAVVFKKPSKASSKKSIARKRTLDSSPERRSVEAAEVGENGEAVETEDQNQDQEKLSLQDALELRKIRRLRNVKGVNVESLLSTSTQVKQPSKAKEQEGGLQQSSKTETHFTSESTAMDTEKHMQEFIEKQLATKRSNAASGRSTSSLGFDDVDGPIPASALSHLNSHKHQTIDQEVLLDPIACLPDLEPSDSNPAALDGDLKFSAKMLTMVQEVSLGVDVKLQNIEQTERARSELYRSRRVELESTNTLGAPLVDRYKVRHASPPRERARDDIVFENFKKRMRTRR